ncbi:hypothetical protein NGB36_17025 [Streptomyces sp. RB6PN25]|uniref:Uncharacterized protein n=1 Tax=Streptomyces humicola TaxID=2953240 RepID=A0ABT1PX68_9ACTN|nr:hypothetical protein [Streptomyces humicola]MCQ4082264.1 hypothetical protein [Streptomyces humicola]
MGKGAPDGWTYFNAHGIAFAVPKDWRRTATADLPPGVLAAAHLDEHGTQIADVEVLTRKPPTPKGYKLTAKPSTPFKMGGHLSTEVNYAFLSKTDGLPRRVTEVTTKTASGRPVVVLITASGKGAGSWVDTMYRIANSIQIGTIGKGNLVKT